MITLRAIDNLVHGYGLVTNPPERVLGFSNPLWAPALMLPHSLGLSGYATAIVTGVVVSAAAAACALGLDEQGPTPWRLEALRRVFGADRRTLDRWRRFWVERVGGSRVFEIGRADFMPPPDAARLPVSLLESFIGTACERAVHALSWLARQFGSRFATGEMFTQNLHADRFGQGS